MTGAAEVLVVGAGPGGSALAWRLARAGVDVLVVDACEFPRSKPCGDAISPGATPLLAEMDVLDRIRAAGAARLVGWRIRTPDGTWFGSRFDAERRGSPPEGLALARWDLDRILLDAARRAGARFLPRHRVFAVGECGRGDRTVRARNAAGREVELRGRWVVGADGLRSVVARRTMGVRRGRRERLALVGRFRGVDAARTAPDMPGPEPEERPEAPGGDAAIGEMRIGQGGCLGLAPIGPGRINITVVVPLAAARAIAADRGRFYFRELERYGVADRIRGGALHGPIEATGPFEMSPGASTATRLLLVGDAAGYFDPFTGQGVYRALASARLAAEALTHALERPVEEHELRRRYARSLHDLVVPGRRVQWLVDAVVRRPALIDPIGRVLASNPGLVQLLLDITGDRLVPARLLSPWRLR